MRVYLSVTGLFVGESGIVLTFLLNLILRPLRKKVDLPYY